MQKLAISLGVISSLFFALPHQARGNGRPVNSTGVVAKAGDANKMILGTTFGMTFTQDGGKNWYWVCENVIGGTNSVDNLPLWMADDTLVVAVPTGVFASPDMGCTWTSIVPISGSSLVSDVVIDPSDQKTLYVSSYASGDASVVTTVRKTSDLGKTMQTVFTSSGANQPAVWSIAIAQSRPQRIYLAGWPLQSHTGAVIVRSDDAGATWASLPVSVAFNPNNAYEPVVAVSPTDPNLVLVGVQDISNNKSYIVRSTDGGQTMTNVATMQQPFRRFAFAPDGKTVLAAGIQNIYRSTDAGQTFNKLPKPATNACVAYANDRFYSCGGAYTGDPTTGGSDPNAPVADPNENTGTPESPSGAAAVDCYALATSVDGGNTWQPVMNLAQIKGPANCPADSNEIVGCLADWPDQKRADQSYVLGVSTNPSTAQPFDPSETPFSGLCASPNITDTAPGAPKGDGKGCGCASGGNAATSDSLLTLMTAGAVMMRYRSRQRRRKTVSILH